MLDKREKLKQQLQKSHVPLAITIPGHNDIEILVRRELMVRDVLRQVVRKNPDLGMETDYLFFDVHKQQPIPTDKYIYQLEDVYRLRLENKNAVGSISTVAATRPEEYVVLREVTTKKEFVIEQLPAVIGRSKQSATNVLAVDLIEFGKTVSGRHARITRDEDFYYIENLTEDNKLVVGEQRVGYEQPQTIKDGDIIQIGKVTLEFRVKSKN